MWTMWREVRPPAKIVLPLAVQQFPSNALEPELREPPDTVCPQATISSPPHKQQKPPRRLSPSLSVAGAYGFRTARA